MKIKRPPWTREHNIRFIKAIKPFPKEAPGIILFNAIRSEFSKDERSDSAITTRMYRINNAGKGKCYYSDCGGDQKRANKKYLPIRDELCEFGLVKTQIDNIKIIPKSERWFTAHQRANPSGKTRERFTSSMWWREDVTVDEYLESTSIDEVLTEYNIVRRGDRMAPLSYKGCQRYISGYLNHNKGYETGGSKHFVTFVESR